MSNFPYYSTFLLLAGIIDAFKDLHEAVLVSKPALVNVRAMGGIGEGEAINHRHT